MRYFPLPFRTKSIRYKIGWLAAPSWCAVAEARLGTPSSKQAPNQRLAGPTRSLAHEHVTTAQAIRGRPLGVHDALYGRPVVCFLGYKVQLMPSSFSKRSPQSVQNVSATGRLDRVLVRVASTYGVVAGRC